MIKIKELPLINVILHESLNETVFDVHPKKINIQTDNFNFETLYIPAQNSNELLILLSSGGRAVSDTRFDRWSIHGYSGANVLCVEDPMYKLHRLTTGWYFGTKDHSAINELKSIADKIMSDLAIEHRNVCTIGSSCGGYAAVKLANLIGGCNCIAMNPQLVISNWGKPALRLAKAVQVDLYNDPSNRNDLTYIKEDRDTNYFLMCNTNHRRDWRTQMKVLFDKVSPVKVAENVYANHNITFYLSSNRYARPHTNVINSFGLVLMNKLLKQSGSDKYDAIQALMNTQEKEWMFADSYLKQTSWNEFMISTCFANYFQTPVFEDNKIRLKSLKKTLKMIIKKNNLNTRFTVIFAFVKVSVCNSFISFFNKNNLKGIPHFDLIRDNRIKVELNIGAKEKLMNIFEVVTSFLRNEEKHQNINSNDVSSMFNNDIFEKYSNYNNLYEFRSKFRLDDSIFNDSNQFFNLSDINDYVQGSATIDVHGIKYNTFLFNSDTKKLYVSLTSGNRKNGKDILFTRWKWKNYFDGCFLAVDDPMFQYNPKFPKNLMGWFYGTNSNNFLDKTAELIQGIAKAKNIDCKDIVLMGSSSGGMASLYISNKLPGCSVMAFNPQLSLADWPYAKNFEKAANVNLSSQDDRNTIKISADSNNRYFVYFNLLSKEDGVQMKYLLKTIGCPEKKIVYGLNKLADNIYLMASVANYHKVHTTSPNEYETYIISRFLELNKDDRNKAFEDGFFTYMTENISRRYEMMNSLYKAKTMSSNISSEYLSYANQNFERDVKANNYSAVLDDYKALFSLKTFSLPNSYFKSVTHSLKMLNYNKKQIYDYFGSCTSNTLGKVSSLIQEIKSKDFISEKVLDDFGEIIESLYKNTDVISSFKEGFSIILDALQEKEIPCYTDDIESSSDSSLKYVIASKFLSTKDTLGVINESDKDNYNYHVVSEKCNLIGFNTGFAGFVQYKDSKESLISHTIDFFFKNLLGYSNFRSVAQFKQIITAYDYSHRTKNQADYAKQVKKISIVLAHLIQTDDFDNREQLLRILGRELIRLISLAMNLPMNKCLFFQRLTHVGMENCVNYLNFRNETI